MNLNMLTPLTNNIDNPTLKAFLKWKNLPSVFNIFSIHGN